MSWVRSPPAPPPDKVHCPFTNESPRRDIGWVHCFPGVESVVDQLSPLMVSDRLRPDRRSRRERQRQGKVARLVGPPPLHGEPRGGQLGLHSGLAELGADLRTHLLS